MAKLINGNGNPAVYAAEDADWFAAIMGNQTSITGIGEQFRADQADANTIEVFDGVIITKEGRRIQLDANAVDLFEIPTGVPGTTSYYIIGYHLYNDENSNQFCEVFTQKMDTSSETIPEDTFRGGADEVFVSLYRVTQDELTITDIDLLLPSIGNLGSNSNDIAQLRSDLSNKQNKTDNNLTTTSKQVVGAINELNNIISQQSKNLLSANVSTTGIVNLNDSLSKFRTITFVTYQANADSYVTFSIPSNYFLSDTSKRYLIYDVSSRTMIVKSNNNTSINIVYVTGNVVLVGVLGCK